MTFKHTFIAFAALLFLASPSLAKPWHYNFMLDLETEGDVLKVTDDSDMQMTFDVSYPYWLVRHELRSVMEDAKMGFESETGDVKQAYLTSRWFINSVDGAANLFSGIDQVRVKFEGRVANLGPSQTRLILLARFQVQKSNNNRGWVDKSERELRNAVREMAASTFLRCRYPTELAVRQSVVEDYTKLRKRQGKKGYEMPPRQRLSQNDANEVLSFSWCDQENCFTMPSPGANYCAAHKPAPKQVIVQSNPASVADEIRKLKGLLDEGLITADEFQEQKRKLMD